VRKLAVAHAVRSTTTSHGLIDTGGGKVIMASITNGAAEELQLAAGTRASAVIKASDVMVMVDRLPYRGDPWGAKREGELRAN
jgi:molybdopterin-binding protein